MKIVIGAGWGGFDLSREAAQELDLEIVENPGWGAAFAVRGQDDIPRNDPKLIEVVERLGDGAGDGLTVIEIPDGTEWDILISETGSEVAVEKGHWWTA